ncbi:hypothetical protein M885DRAFT_479531 [Pelagophyceae sp. CCMP2097]|nr:hypothetical protein M885DRAFT_479531 [Pelagophyceae sp. CCMP2097]|mmetsp:Transcript_986/g.3535  ORF Transcript_986/g.3535 Transcript_986/m.3535 type:complete len:330 (-) Transcript_986:28-1017(-)
MLALARCYRAAGGLRRPAAAQTRGLHVLRSIGELRDWRKGRQGDVGLVPTMGALHEGHISLLHRARQECDSIICSIFVNPTQFGPRDDLDKYPRTIESDLAALEAAGADAAFLPNAADMYPDDSPSRRFAIQIPDGMGPNAESAESTARPGHFGGVATVCAKLFNLTNPTRAYFGQKDAMQCVVIRRLVKDLDFDVQIVVAETLRAEDGLALSSRNAYLTPVERAAAPVVYRCLEAARAAWLAWSSRQPVPSEPVPSDFLVSAAKRVLATEPLVGRIEYISVGCYDTMRELASVPAPDGAAPAGIVSIALRLGNVRLIDNLPLTRASGH